MSMAGVPTIVDATKAYDPTGTLQELRDISVNTLLYRSCSMPEDGRNSGCSQWHNCNFPYKGVHQLDEDGEQVGGPHFVGCYYVSPSGGSLNQVRACFDYLHAAKEIRESRGVLEIIAEEGEPILDKGTESVPVNPKNPAGRHKAQPFMRQVLVPRFPRPKDVFINEVYESKVRELIFAREARLRREAAIGDTDAAIAAATKLMPVHPDQQAIEKKAAKP